MKSTILFLAAFTFSGAVFAQTAVVKAGGSMNTRVQPGQTQTTANGSGGATLSGPAGNSTGGVQTTMQQGAQAATTAVATPVEATGRQAIQAGISVMDAQATVQAAAQQTLKTGEVAVPSGVQPAAGQTLKAGTGVIHAASGINAATRPAVKVAPVRVNTKITGSAGLGIL